MPVAHLSFHELSSDLDRLEALLRESILLTDRMRYEPGATGPGLADMVRQQVKLSDELSSALQRLTGSVYALRGHADPEAPFSLFDACAMSDLACGSDLVARCSTIAELVEELCLVHKANGDLFASLASGVNQFARCLSDSARGGVFYDGEGETTGSRDVPRMSFSI